MKNFILKYRVKILLTIFFALLLLTLNNKAFAFDVVDNTGNSTNTYSIPELSSEYQDYLNTKPYIIRKFNSYITIAIAQDDSSYFCLYYDTSILAGNFYIASYDGSSWTYSSKTYTSAMHYGWDLSQNIYYNANIYTDIDKTDLFFHVAPPEEIPKAGTLQEIMEQVEKEAVLKEIVVLLPVILSVLVSLIALRKALRVLLNSLRAS